MANTVKSLEQKVQSAIEREPNETLVGFTAWLENVTGLDIDADSVKVGQRLYGEYTKLPEVQEQIKARKAANAEARESRGAAAEQKVFERLAKMDKADLLAKLKELGVEVAEAE